MLIKELNYKYSFSSYYCTVIGTEDVTMNQSKNKRIAAFIEFAFYLYKTTEKNKCGIVQDPYQ